MSKASKNSHGACYDNWKNFEFRDSKGKRVLPGIAAGRHQNKIRIEKKKREIKKETEKRIASRRPAGQAYGAGTREERMEREMAKTSPSLLAKASERSVHPGHLLSNKLREELVRNNGEQAEILAKSLIVNAVKGNAGAIKTIFDRIEGPLDTLFSAVGNGKIEYTIRFESNGESQSIDNSADVSYGSGIDYIEGEEI